MCLSAFKVLQPPVYRKHSINFHDFSWMTHRAIERFAAGLVMVFFHDFPWMAHRAIERFAAGLVMVFLHDFPWLTHCAMERVAASHTIYFARYSLSQRLLSERLPSYDQIEK